VAGNFTVGLILVSSYPGLTIDTIINTCGIADIWEFREFNRFGWRQQEWGEQAWGGQAWGGLFDIYGGYIGKIENCELVELGRVPDVQGDLYLARLGTFPSMSLEINL
jgi:hypothetical protein